MLDKLFIKSCNNKLNKGAGDVFLNNIINIIVSRAATLTNCQNINSFASFRAQINYLFPFKTSLSFNFFV